MLYSNTVSVLLLSLKFATEIKYSYGFSDGEMSDSNKFSSLSYWSSIIQNAISTCLFKLTFLTYLANVFIKPVLNMIIIKISTNIIIVFLLFK